MRKINDKYFLDTDAFSYIIREKKIRKNGKEFYDPIAFCGNLVQLKDYLVNKEVREDINLLDNIDKVIELSHTIDKVFATTENNRKQPILEKNNEIDTTN